MPMFSRKSVSSAAPELTASDRLAILNYARQSIQLQSDGLWGRRIIYANEMLLCFLLPDAEELQTAVAEAFRHFLSSSTLAELISASWMIRSFFSLSPLTQERLYRWEHALPDIRLDRRDYPHLTDEQYPAFLIIGTWHYNGHFRENSLHALLRWNGGLYSERYGFPLSPLFFSLLRLNDWAEPISAYAAECAAKLSETAPVSDLLFSIPLLVQKINEYARQRDRFLIAKEQFISRIRRDMSEKDFPALLRIEDASRSTILHFLVEHDCLSPALLHALFRAERTGTGRVLILESLQQHGLFTEEEEARCLHDRTPEIRYLALWHRYERLQTAWDDLPVFLTDKSRKLRESARYILQKSGLDSLALLFSSLPEVQTAYELVGGQAVMAARSRLCLTLTSLGETKDKAALPAVEAYLSDGDEALRRTALNAWSEIVGEDGAEVYLTNLLGPSESVALTAYRIIRRTHCSYDCELLYNEYLSRAGTRLGDKLLTLLFSAGSWERLPWLLRLLGCPSLRDEQRTLLLLRCRQRNPYMKLNDRSREEIALLLEEKAALLPEQLYDAIRFDLSKL